MVVGAVLVMNLGTPADAPMQMAEQAVPAPGPVQAVVAIPPEVAVPIAEPQVLIADGQLIRDARLDRYLAAHKPFGGSPALAMPSGFVRARASNVEGSR
jgi:sigma-E factor negative regulatory protein RseA